MNDTTSIKSFKSIEDIKKLVGFAPDYPVIMETFSAIYGDYHLPNNQAQKCCLLTKNLCHQPHQNGLIVQCKNGSLTLIGGVCGKKHLGENFISANTAYEKQKENDQKSEKFNNLFSNKEELLTQITRIKNAAHAVEKNIIQIEKLLPRPILTELKNQSKNGDQFSIKIRVIISSESHTLGIIYGLSIFHSYRIKNIMSDISALQRSYNLIFSNKKLTYNQRNTVLTSIGMRDQIESRISELQSYLTTFKNSSLHNLIFITENVTDQVSLFELIDDLFDNSRSTEQIKLDITARKAEVLKQFGDYSIQLFSHIKSNLDFS